MSKHAADTASNTKKVLAAGGLAFSLAGLGLFAGVGTAAAAPDTGSYDELMDLAQDATWGGIPSPPGTATVAFEGATSAANLGAMVPDPEEAGCHHSRITSSYPAASYPAASSWPGGNAKP